MTKNNSKDNNEEQPITIFELLGSPKLPIKTSLADNAAAEVEVQRVLGLLKKSKIDVEYPSDVASLFFYDALLIQLMPKMIYRSDIGEGIDLSYDEFGSDYEDLEANEVCEAFLLALFHPGQEFATALLHETVRLKSDVVSPALAVAYIQEWWSGFSSIQPLGYQSAGFIDDETEATLNYQFMVAYEVTLIDGAIDMYEGMGVMQFKMEAETGVFKVFSVQIPGFEL